MLLHFKHFSCMCVCPKESLEIVLSIVFISQFETFFVSKNCSIETGTRFLYIRKHFIYL